MIININTMTVGRKNAVDSFVNTVDARELRVGDRVGQAKWTIETIDINDVRVLAMGSNSRGDRFVINGKPNKPVRVWR